MATRSDNPAQDWQSAAENHLLTAADAAWPPLLAQISNPPHLLYVAGDPDILQLPALAIVGSRNPTKGGERNAFEFAQHLAGAGFTIVSGLAQGIDTAAHRGALAAGGKTVAVLGHGIDRVYPPQNESLARDIVSNGALLSEFPLGAAPRREFFPQRNRLISGLSLGTLVVEAARRSGSLITARLAGEQGREVFALPGSIHNALARGCHELIRQGAKLIETTEDIVNELAPLTAGLQQNAMESTSKQIAAAALDGEYVQLREHIGHDPITVDQLAQNSGLTIDQVSSMLLILELHGEIESLSGGRYTLTT